MDPATTGGRQGSWTFRSLLPLSHYDLGMDQVRIGQSYIGGLSTWATGNLQEFTQCPLTQVISNLFDFWWTYMNVRLRPGSDEPVTSTTIRPIAVGRDLITWKDFVVAAAFFGLFTGRTWPSGMVIHDWRGPMRAWHMLPDAQQLFFWQFVRHDVATSIPVGLLMPGNGRPNLAGSPIHFPGSFRSQGQSTRSLRRPEGRPSLLEDSEGRQCLTIAARVLAALEAGHDCSAEAEFAALRDV
jgi:hypothetical protein